MISRDIQFEMEENPMGMAVDNDDDDDFRWLDDDGEERDPYETDEFSDYDPKEDMEELLKSQKDKKKKVPVAKKTVKRANKKQKKDMSMEDKLKLAGLVKAEELIWNLQNKLHSNHSAVSAAWERIATKMNGSGE